jgi:hypothetical protein
MTEEQRQTREVAIDFIKKTWGLDDVYDAFPTSVKPPNLGNTGMSYLKSLATRVPNKKEAQKRMLDECTSSTGERVRCGHSVLVRMVRSLMESGPASAASTSVKSKGSSVKSTPEVVQPKRAPKAAAAVSQRLNPDYTFLTTPSMFLSNWSSLVQISSDHLPQILHCPRTLRKVKLEP